MFYSGVWHILLLSDILDFVLCDLQLQRAYCDNLICFNGVGGGSMLKYLYHASRVPKDKGTFNPRGGTPGKI